MKIRGDHRRTFGRYIFFQHRSHSTLPPSTWIHLPSSIGFTQRTHVLVLGRFVDALRGFPVASARSSAASRFDGSVGLVCERMGGFGDLVALSLWLSLGRFGGLSAGRREELAVEIVGEVGSSSRSVSMTWSRAPVDFDGVRGAYEEEAADDERERWGARGDWAVEDEEDEYRDSVMDGNRTLLSFAAGGAVRTSFDFAGVAMGWGLARRGTSKGWSSSSSELAYASPS